MPGFLQRQIILAIQAGGPLTVADARPPWLDRILILGISGGHSNRYIARVW